MIEITYELKDVVICALRYAIGRKTYVTLEVAEFIMKNPNLIDERVCIVMLRDLNWYFSDVERGLIHEDKCDYDNWINLQNWLFKIAKEKEFNVVGYERR